MSIKQIMGGLILGAAMMGTAAADAKKDKPAEKPAEKAPAKTEKVALVDINSASQEELEALPGIGKEHCHHIIMGRPYAKKEDLVSKNVIPQDAYDKIKDRVVAKAEKPAPKK